MPHPEPRSETSAEPAPDRTALRCEVEPQRRLPGVLLLTIAGIWIAVPLLALADGRPALPGLELAGSCSLVALGVAQLLWALHVLLRRRTLIIQEATLQLVEHGLLGVRSWREPLARYRGLRHRRQRVRHRDRWRLIHRLELAHPEPTKTICLMSTRDERRLAATARQWAQVTGLPVFSSPPSAGTPARDGRPDHQRPARTVRSGVGSPRA